MSQPPELAATLGSLAAQRPAAIPVFERFDLDYCCGGDRTVAAACQERGLDARAILEAIDAEEAASAALERSWTDATMTELADHIEQTHHAFLRDALARLTNILPRILAAHAGRHPELHRIAEVLRNLTAELTDHMVREERVLFPWLRRLERPTEIQGGPPWSVRRPISCMVHDHDDVGAALAELRALTGGFKPPADACGLYRSMLDSLRAIERDTHIHIHKENNILFPAGVRAEDQRAAHTPGEAPVPAGPTRR